MGRPWRTLRIGEYYQYKAELASQVDTSLDMQRLEAIVWAE